MHLNKSECFHLLCLIWQKPDKPGVSQTLWAYPAPCLERRLMTHSIFLLYKQLVTSHSIDKIWKVPLKLLDIIDYEDSEMEDQMLTSPSHGRPFVLKPFLLITFFLCWCKRWPILMSQSWVFTSFIREWNKNGFTKKNRKERFSKYARYNTNIPQQFYCHLFRRNCVYFISKMQFKDSYFACFVYIWLCRWCICVLQTWWAVVNKAKVTKRAPGPLVVDRFGHCTAEPRAEVWAGPASQNTGNTIRKFGCCSLSFKNIIHLRTIHSRAFI